MKFTHAIVKTPATTIARGLTSANLGLPIYEKAIKQHQQYIDALKTCGLEVTILNSDDRFPDSCFVEDVALCTGNGVIITNPGAPSRNGEKAEIKPHLFDFFNEIDAIQPPGTVEAGDIMMVDNHFYIGLSDRTNESGANQIKHVLESYSYSVSFIELNTMLHLKTGVSYIENNNLLVYGEFIDHPDFNTFNKITIPKEEAYAANSVWINNFVLVPSGHPITSKKIRELGYEVINLDMSEFQKIDGGLSCLSLRF